MHGLEDAYFSNAVHITGSAAALPLTFSGPRLASTPPPLAYIDSRGAEKTFNFSQYVNAAGPYTPSPLRYSFSVNNHALLSIEASDETTGAVTLKTRNATGDAKLKVRVTAVEAKADVTVLEILTDIIAVQDDADPVRSATAWPDVTGAQTLNLSLYFSDADGFDHLTFTATVSDSSVVTATVDGANLVLENAMSASGTSTATVTVVASDPDASVADDLTVTFVFENFRYLAFHGIEAGGNSKMPMLNQLLINSLPASSICTNTDDIAEMSCNEKVSILADMYYCTDGCVHASRNIFYNVDGYYTQFGTLAAGGEIIFYVKVPPSFVFTRISDKCGTVNTGSGTYGKFMSAELLLRDNLPASNEVSSWSADAESCPLDIAFTYP